MTRILLIFILAVELSAQTNVYLRASAPAPQIIAGATNSTPIVVQTATPHSFPASCNLTTNICYCGGSDLATGTGLSPANRVMECTVNDATHLNLYDLSGAPIAGNGNWWKSGSLYQNGSSPAQYIGLLTKFTIPANPGPMGFLDGTNGDLTRRVAGNAYNGTSGLTVTGCPSACVITWTVSYSFASSKFPMQPENHFSISGTGTSLDTCGDGTAAAGENSPYTAASVSGGVVTSRAFACPISNGNYLTINPHCGPAMVPNDTIGGTNYCSTVSQMAWTGNILWDQVKADMSRNQLDCSPAPSCRSSFTNYKSVFDGGLIYPGAKIHALYAMAALRFLVDPSQALWLNEILYSLNNDFRASGTGYTYNTAVNIGIHNGDYFYTTDEEGFAIEYGVAYPYWAASEEAAFRDRTYNDLDDPVAGPAVSTNMDAANRSTHNWVLSAGNLAAGTNDATHFTLPASDPHYGANGYYVGTVVELHNGGENYYNSYSYGLITAYSGGVATAAGGFSHNSPALNNLTDATYTGGFTGCQGTVGQVITLAFGVGGGYGTLAFTGTNTLGTNATITSPGTYAAAPTTATVIPYGNATCSGTGNFTTHIGTAYIIYDTFTLSSTVGGATTTATFTKTTNLNSGTTPPLQVGDQLMAYNGWGLNFFSPAANSSIVKAVGTNTVTVINSYGVTASTSNPQMAWRLPQWSSGDTGRIVPQKSFGVQSFLYGAGTGGVAAVGTFADGNPNTNIVLDNAVNGGGANLDAWLALDLAVAADSGDPRAVRDLARQMYMVDWGVRPVMDFSTGRFADGPGYSIDGDIPTADLIMWALTQTIPTYPKMDIDTGLWGILTSLWTTMSTLPDLNGGGAFPTGWAGSGGFQANGYGYGPGSLTSMGLALNPIFSFAPSSNLACYFRNWQEHVRPDGVSIWGVTETERQALAFLHNDPRICSSSWTVQPHQYAFTKSSSAAAAAYLGWPSFYRGDAVISRSGMGGSTNDSFSLFDCATYRGGGVYDNPRSCQFSLWDTGALIGSDANPANQGWVTDPTALSDTIGFNSAGYNQFTGGAPPAITPVTLWASDTAGSFGAQYGDDQSRYMATCGNELPNYNQSRLGLSLSRVSRCVGELKVSGHDHFYATFDEVALASGTATITWHLHYPQNGQTQQGGSTNNNPTGSTTCPGAGACASLNTNGRIIKTMQDGGGSSPARTHGLLTYVTSPGTIYLADNCIGHASGQCAPGDTYSGGAGYTHRFEIGGGASAGTNVSNMTSVAGHKLMSNLSDTTLTPTDLNPDGNWTGVKLAGANSTGVVLFGRNGAHNAMAGFTAASALPVDWMFVGMAPGTYAVTVAGTPVSGSPFTVGAGSNTIFFSTPAGGVVSLGTTVGAPTSATGRFSISGNAVIR